MTRSSFTTNEPSFHAKFTCDSDCGNVLFFGSSRCLRCLGNIGYDPQQRAMVKLRQPGPMKRCANGLKHGVCNWVVPTDSKQTLCMACQMNRIIPDLSSGRNLVLWGRMEMAKRRLIYTLLKLGITLPSKASNPKYGLAFDIVSTLSNPSVTMGHLNGIITVNLEEADDTYRQFNRQQLGENSRTLLGHFRHESAHYLWQRHLSELSWDHPMRLAFASALETSGRTIQRLWTSTTRTAHRQAGSSITSQPTQHRIPGKTGRRLGLIICKSKMA